MGKYYRDGAMEAGILADAKILISVATKEEIEGSKPGTDIRAEVWERFKAAGGNPDHSGASWWAVEDAALGMLAESSEE